MKKINEKNKIPKIVSISVKGPSSFGGSEIVWKNLQENGFLFKNLSLEEKTLPKLLKKVPNVFHLKEIFSSNYLLKQAEKESPLVIIYDKIFGWPKIKTIAKRICYNHGSYTLAGLTFRSKNWGVYLFYKFIISYFEKRSYKNADKIIAVSDSVKKEMVEYFRIPPEKIFIIKNGINLKKFCPIKEKKVLRKKLGLPLNKKVIFFPGRASFGKGFDIAERILEKLGEDYFMFVLGKGDSSLKNIKFIGEVDNEKMPEVYNCADWCIFPSRYEGNSVSVIESASCGVPLLLSKVGEMKNNKLVQEFGCDSVDEYIKKIKTMNIKNSSEKWRVFSKDFDIRKQINRLKEVLEYG
ncbi:glycosyltransferase [Patescibacteria group bacterium]|nr:glycosyltransferase [Patescibacteria group bacterium]